MKVGEIELSFLGHAGFLISNGKKVVIDPYNVSSNVGKADIILITHSHYDHCSIKDIELVAKSGTVIVCPVDCQSKIVKIKDIDLQVIEIGDEIDFGTIKIKAVPAYNVNKKFHPKNEKWLGYVIKMRDVIVYHAGDTDLTPDMKNLTGYGKHENNFVALLPVSGQTVMDAEEAAEAASLLGADLTIPMHYGAGVVGTRADAERFMEICIEKDINAKILEKT